MPAPKNLTLCEPPELDWSREAAPASSSFGDIYFSVDGGLAEAQEVFLKACGLPERWEDCGYFAIGELGFGTGLNFLAAWKLWNETNAATGRLHFISIEKYPLDQAQLRKALSNFPDMSVLSKQLIDKWPGRVKGFHTIDFGNVRLTLIHDDILDGLGQIDGLIDAWFLDGFSPARNPDMWSIGVMTRLADLSSPGARAGTFTVARAVRDALTQAGFNVDKKPGYGRKRDRLEAVFSGPDKRRAKPATRPIIIGAGIAGSMLARALRNRGIHPVIIDPDDDSGASGNPAAIVKPRLDMQDRPESRFFLSSYLYACQVYEALGSVSSVGVVHYCKDEPETARYQKLLACQALPERFFRALKEPDHKDRDVFCAEFPKALVINPARALAQAAGNIERIKGRANSVHQTPQGLSVLDEIGHQLALGDHVIWSCGFGIRNITAFKDQKLRYSRGQISLSDMTISETRTFGGYAISMNGQTLLGATHKRLDEHSPIIARPGDDHENIEKYENLFGHRPEINPQKSRSSVRVTTPNTLPLIVNHGDEWALTGLGSRGFVFAPLLADAIAAKICGEVLPISNKVWARFQAREKIQPENAPEKTPDKSSEA